MPKETEDNEKAWYYCPTGGYAKYGWWGPAFEPRKRIVKYLRAWRKRTIIEQEHWIKLKKEFKDDREFAKFAKEQERYWLKLKRAITLYLPHHGAPDKDQKDIRVKYFPVDLADELDEVAERIILRFC